MSENIQDSNVKSETKDQQVLIEKAKTNKDSNQISVTNESFEQAESNDDIFITESDLFECTVKYYKIEHDILVQNVDDNFDKNVPCKIIKFKCKYPSQADYQTLINSAVFKNINENINGIDVAKMEIARLSLLIRSWSVSSSLDKLLDVDPKIIKGMLLAVNGAIGLKGLF